MRTCARERVVQVGAVEERRIDLGHGRRLAGNIERLCPLAIERRSSAGWATRQGMTRRVHVLGRVGAGRVHERQGRNGDGEGVGKRNRRRATREVMRGSRTHAIETLDSSGELLTLHSLEKKLGDVFTALLILCGNDRLGLLFLVLIVHGTKTIVRVHLLVLGLCMFCLDLPDTLLLQRKGAPAVT
jgi:hypothetical protein